jgi:hypothetical protein
LIPARLRISIVVVLVVAGCTQERQVRRDFLKDHPSYTIVSIGDPDGNDTTVVTFHVRYRKPNDNCEYWADWAYETKGGKFELVGKGIESIYAENVGTGRSPCLN